MNPPDPGSLPLRDIHLPHAISWWPPAPGWWLLAIALLIGITAIGALWYRRRRYRVQRAAQAELVAFEQAWLRDGDAHAFARELSGLSRRLALACGVNAAAATGVQWLQLLERLGGQALPAELRAVLLEAPYSADRAAAIDASAYAQTAAVMRLWIDGTRNPPSPGSEHV